MLIVGYDDQAESESLFGSQSKYAVGQELCIERVIARTQGFSIMIMIGGVGMQEH